MPEDKLSGREVIFEMTQVGQYVRITAMDTQTKTEISMQGPVTASKEILQMNAMKKLQYVMQKKGLLS